MNIYTAVFPHAETRSSTDPQQRRLSTCSALPDTPHPRWKCCLMVVITVTTRFSDLSFKYTHCIILPFLHGEKKWIRTTYVWLTFSFQVPEALLCYPGALWRVTERSRTDRQTRRTQLPSPAQINSQPKMQIRAQKHNHKEQMKICSEEKGMFTIFKVKPVKVHPFY